MNELRWRVIYGYKTSEYVSIGEEHIEKAKYAWVMDKKFIAPDGKMISGKEIKRIEPDIRYYTGWLDSYDYGSFEDQQQIKRDVPLKEIEERSILADNRIKFVLEKKQPELLKTPEKIDTLLLN